MDSTASWSHLGDASLMPVVAAHAHAYLHGGASGRAERREALWLHTVPSLPQSPRCSVALCRGSSRDHTAQQREAMAARGTPPRVPPGQQGLILAGHGASTTFLSSTGLAVGLRERVEGGRSSVCSPPGASSHGIPVLGRPPPHQPRQRGGLFVFFLISERGNSGHCPFMLKFKCH